MKKKRRERRHYAEAFAKGIMTLSLILVAGGLGWILWTVVIRGLPSLTLEMIGETPKGGFYLGGGGGVLNAIVGSLYLAGGGTVLAAALALPLALYLKTYLEGSRWGRLSRLSLDVLWGIPSIVYGAFGFTVMLAIGMRASLLGGIVVLALVELPIMARAMDEVIRRMPSELELASLALGSTRLETALRVTVRQMLPGILTAVLLAFGRGIGDAASVLFTAGYSDRVPSSLASPAASLPLAIFYQLGSPYPEVRRRGYASALILTILVLLASLGSRLVASRARRYSIK